MKKSMFYRGSGITKIEIRTQPEANLAILEDFGFLVQHSEILFFFFFNDTDIVGDDAFEMSLREYLPLLLDLHPYILSVSFEQKGN